MFPAVPIRWRFWICAAGHRVTIVCAHVNYITGRLRTATNRSLKPTAEIMRFRFIRWIRLRKRLETFKPGAREARYAFFARLAVQEAAAGVLIAQHLDDFLETALLQQESGRQCEVLGIREEGRVLGVARRPAAVKLDERQLQEYCDRHKIAYGIDESNLSDDYRRNQLRHHELAKLSEAEKRSEVRKLKARNRSRQKKKEAVKTKLNPADPVISQEIFLALSEAEQRIFLRAWMQEPGRGSAIGSLSHRADQSAEAEKREFRRKFQ